MFSIWQILKVHNDLKFEMEEQKVKKTFICLFLILCMLLSMITALPAVAASGTCGSNLTWTLNDSGTLTVSGTGNMEAGYIWVGKGLNIRSVVIKDGVTSISNSAFYGNENLTSVKMADSVTSIGDSAFGSCENLSSLTLSPNITNIAKKAFQYCKSITSFKIPSNVAVIENETFEFCRNLKTVDVPDGVTKIGNSAFGTCDLLQNITIPNTVREIGNYAFFQCKSIKSIKIPYGVTTIGTHTFSACANLSSVEIPNSVTTIEWSAFDNCYSLKSIKIPISVTTLGKTVFSACPNLKDMYYLGTKNDWGYIKVDSTNYPVLNHNGTTIHYENKSIVSDLAQIIYNGISYNLLSQPINIDKDSNAEVTVRVCYNNLNINQEIYLSQNAEKFLELENGVSNTFTPTKVFEADKDIYIVIRDIRTGVTRSERTSLKIVNNITSNEFMPSSEIEGLNFKVIDGVSFTVPECVPIFEGTEIKWEYDFVPISVEYDHEDNSKLNIVFGFDIVHTDGEENKYFKNFDFKKYKKDVKKAASKQNRTLKQLKNDFKLSKQYKMNMFGGKVVGGGKGKSSTDVDFAGYAECKFIDGEWKLVEGQLCLNVEASYKYQGQLFIWAVPVYYEIGLGIGAEFEGDVINIDPKKFIPEFENYLTAKLTGELGGGIGVAKFATVGASGEGSLNMKSALHKEYLKVWGEGEADFNIKIFGKEVAKKTFAKGDFLIYETGNAKGLLKDKDITIIEDSNGNDGGNFSGGGGTLGGGGGGGRLRTSSASYSAFADISSNDTYDNESRAYASSLTEWYGDMPPVSMFDAEYTSKNLKLLAENVYTESAPIMCNIDGQKVMVMLWDNSERDDINRTMLVYSVYDDKNGIWSAPLPVCDDGTADFYPSFNDGYLVWQNEKSLLNDDMTLSDIAELGEICVSKWNGNGFDTPVTLTENDSLDTLPVVCASETEVSVIWTTNSENDILGLNGFNSIMKSVFTGSAWSEPVVVKANLNAITNLSAGYTDSGLNIAYVADEDNDLETIDDRDISIISESNEYMLTDNDVLDSNPQIKGNKIYYYSGGNIMYGALVGGEQSSVFKEAKAGLTDNFTVSENANGDAVILWAKSAGNAVEIFSAMCNDGKWSDEIQISETGNRSKYPTAVLENNGSVYIAYNNGIVKDGEILQSDLYVIDLIPSYDLSVSDAYIDEDSMTVYATVKNTGELNVASYTVILTDNGINAQKTVTDSLKAGESATVEIEYVKPENLTKHQIILSVDMGDAEYNTDNNSATLTVGSCDVSIKSIQSHEILPDSVAVATVSNDGYSDTGAVTVCLRRNSADGEIVATQTVSNIPKGESVDVAFEYNITNADNIQWYITAESENEEISSGNNDAYFINNYSSTVSKYGHEILVCEMSDNSLIVNAYAENNTDTDFSGVSVLAVYNSKGVLKATAHSDIYVHNYDSTSVDLTVDNYTYASGDYIKLFLWKDLESLVPICEAEYCAIIKK